MFKASLGFLGGGRKDQVARVGTEELLRSQDIGLGDHEFICNG